MTIMPSLHPLVEISEAIITISWPTAPLVTGRSQAAWNRTATITPAMSTSEITLFITGDIKKEIPKELQKTLSKKITELIPNIKNIEFTLPPTEKNK